MINLERRPDRREKMMDGLRELGISVTTVNAVDGKWVLKCEVCPRENNIVLLTPWKKLVASTVCCWILCMWWYTKSLLAWYLTNCSCDFHQIYSVGAVLDKDKLVRIWDQKVKGQNHSETICGQLGTLEGIFSSISRMQRCIVMSTWPGDFLKVMDSFINYQSWTNPEFVWFRQLKW